MSLTHLNTYIAQSWPQLEKDFLEPGIRAGVAHFATGSPLNLRLLNTDLALDFTPSPGFSQLDPGHLTLALPLATTGWGLSLTGTLKGSGLGGSINTPIRAELKHLRILVDALYDTTVPDRPQPQSVSLSVAPELTFSLTGDHLSLTLEHWESTPTSQGSVHSNTLKSKATLTLGQVTLGGTLELNLSQEPVLALHLSGAFPLTLTLLKSLPESLKTLLKELETGQLPLAYGEVTASSPSPVIPGPNPVDIATTDFAAEARRIEAALQAQCPFGIVFDGRYTNPAPGAPRSPDFYRGTRDSAIWTGHWLAAEAFRYASAPDSEERDASLLAASQVLLGIEHLFAVPLAATGDPTKAGLMARCVVPAAQVSKTEEPRFDDPTDGTLYFKRFEDAHGNVTAQPIVLSDHSAWYGFGRDSDPPSRDQLIGITMGMGYAYRLVPELRPRLRPLIRNLVGYLVKNNWNYPTPTGPLLADGTTAYRTLTSFIMLFHQQLAFLRVAMETESDGPTAAGELSFTALYEEAWQALSELAWLTPWTNTFDPIHKYYKFNLDHGCLGVLLFLEQRPAYQAPLLKGVQILRRALRHHRNAYFNLVWVVAHSPDIRPQLLQQQDGFRGNFTVSQEIKVTLFHWLYWCHQVAGPNGLPLQKTLNRHWLETSLAPGFVKEYAPLSGGFDTYLCEKAAWLSTFALPVHLRAGTERDFTWQRFPFATMLSKQVDGSFKANETCPDFPYPAESTQSPGVDYLIAYYMGRYLRVF